MTYIDAQNLIITTFGTWSFYCLVILTAVIATAVVYLVFNIGWRLIKTSLGWNEHRIMLSNGRKQLKRGFVQTRTERNGGIWGF